MLQEARNGLGTASMVLGSIGSFLAFFPVLFWIAGILGILAVVFGLVAYRGARKGLATNRTSALGGAFFGAISIALTIVMAFVVTAFAKNIDEKAAGGAKHDGASSYSAPPALDGAPQPPVTDDADAGPAEFGQSRAYADGARMTVMAPTEFQPGPRTVGVRPGDRTYRVKMTIFNGSTEPLDLSPVAPRVHDANGRGIDPLFGTRQGRKDFDGTLAPGAQTTAQYPYVVTPEAAKILRIKVSPGLAYEDSTWSGPIG
ncbi:DUF4190 domain-containing protein [Streptomyces sp. NBC_01465]|uniref:DUF4190 domain-containing protein n=1 Tax=Streptomyces sp. NBC_01465 TaxID=2903878 RepID=UPI002E2F07C1|nr:DUF4190 domain-containing protein [Streptomyces sp. NBC_01465]